MGGRSVGGGGCDGGGCVGAGVAGGWVWPPPAGAVPPPAVPVPVGDEPFVPDGEVPGARQLSGAVTDGQLMSDSALATSLTFDWSTGVDVAAGTEVPVAPESARATVGRPPPPPRKNMLPPTA